MYVNENKDIEVISFYNPDKNISKQLDKTLISRSKPEEGKDEVDHINLEPEKELEEGTQQPGNFLSNVIVPVVESIICSISSFFSWLFGSKEEEYNQHNLSVLELDANEDVRANLPDDYNHYNSPDELM